jgi:hypothetical protein
MSRVRDWLLNNNIRANIFTRGPHRARGPGPIFRAAFPMRMIPPELRWRCHDSMLDDPQVRSAAFSGLQWLMNLQNSDGGLPTFCRGWGALPFDRSSADITAHGIQAWLAWLDAAPSPFRNRLQNAIRSALQFLSRTNCRQARGRHCGSGTSTPQTSRT